MRKNGETSLQRARGAARGAAFIAVGAVLAFAFIGEFLGLDVDVVGWSLMAVGVIVVVAAVVRRLRRSA